METLMIIVSGILFTVSTYLMLSRSLLRIILGASIFTHAAHLMLLTLGGLKKGDSPVLGQGAEVFTDPLPQALILTSIVINFALTAFILVLGYRAYTRLGTEDMSELRGSADE